MTLREQKQAIRAFLRTPVWTEEKLWALLAHAQDKLSMWSCCCLIGVATADHALKCQNHKVGEHWWHYHQAYELPLAKEAELAFLQLGGNRGLCGPQGDPYYADALRRRQIRPIIRAELRRRSRLASFPEVPERLALDVASTV